MPPLLHRVIPLQLLLSRKECLLLSKLVTQPFLLGSGHSELFARALLAHGCYCSCLLSLVLLLLLYEDEQWFKWSRQEMEERRIILETDLLLLLLLLLLLPTLFLLLSPLQIDLLSLHLRPAAHAFYLKKTKAAQREGLSA